MHLPDMMSPCLAVSASACKQTFMEWKHCKLHYTCLAVLHCSAEISLLSISCTTPLSQAKGVKRVVSGRVKCKRGAHWEWQWRMTSRMALALTAASFSDKCPRSRIKSNSSPPAKSCMPHNLYFGVIPIIPLQHLRGRDHNAAQKSESTQSSRVKRGV